MTPKREVYFLVQKRLPEDSDYEKSYVTPDPPLSHRAPVRARASWVTRVARWLGVASPTEQRASGDFSRSDDPEQEEYSGAWGRFDAPDLPDLDEHPSRPAA